MTRSTLASGGIHFRTADEEGAWLGKNVARWVDKHFFEPWTSAGATTATTTTTTNDD